MTVGPVASVQTAKNIGAPQAPTGVSAVQAELSPFGLQDHKALAEAFAEAAKTRALPLGTPPVAGGHAGADLAVKAELAAYDQGSDREAVSSFLTPAGTLAAPSQAAAPPPPSFIDPSAFADLLTKLWLREQGRSTREVRVSFGDSAWPATGARLLRLDDGSLQVAVLLGDRGAGDPQSVEALKERLHARGLPVAEISFQVD